MFDDVESFVSRLQKSAEAARVLEHRERGRRTRRRAAGGKGHPRVASEPPPDLFQMSPLSPGSPLPPLARADLTTILTGCPPLSACLVLAPRPHRRARLLPSEGLLTLRSKPPSEAEYTDVLQKIKYAFSLLVRTRPPLGRGAGTANLPRPRTHANHLPPHAPGPAARQHRRPLLSGAVALPFRASADGETRPRPSGPLAAGGIGFDL